MASQTKIPKAVLSVSVLRERLYCRLMLTPEGRDAWAVYCSLLVAARNRYTDGVFYDSTEASQLSGVPKSAIENAVATWGKVADEINQSIGAQAVSPWLRHNQKTIILWNWEKWNKERRGGPRENAGAPQNNQNAARNKQSEQSNQGSPSASTSASTSTTTALSDKSDGEPETSKQQNYSDRFGRFWDFFPRKIGKGKAWAVFKRLKVEDQDAAIEQAEAYAQAYEMAPDQRRQYFKHPATWINARSWEDDHAEWELLIEGK